MADQQKPAKLKDAIAKRYTLKGEVRKYRLRDGSVVDMAKLTVKEARRVHLLHPELLVAKNSGNSTSDPDPKGSGEE